MKTLFGMLVILGWATTASANPSTVTCPPLAPGDTCTVTYSLTSPVGATPGSYTVCVYLQDFSDQPHPPGSFAPGCPAPSPALRASGGVLLIDKATGQPLQ